MRSGDRAPIAMARALGTELRWEMARVVELVDETELVRSVVLDAPRWPGHRPGQHLALRVPGCRARPSDRRYSIASAPEDGYVVLTIETISGGVSAALMRELAVGDIVEIRGPLGRSFSWASTDPRSPLLLIAEGIGVVPFRAILRHRAAAGSSVPVRLRYAARSLHDVIYREELLRYSAFDEVDIRLALTHNWPPGWHGGRGGIDQAVLHDACQPPWGTAAVFVSGRSTFVELVTRILTVELPDRRQIRTQDIAA